MHNDHLLSLLTKHHAGTLTPEEAAELRQWYAELHVPAGPAAGAETPLGETTAQRLLRDFRARQMEGDAHAAARPVARRRRWYAAVAASLLLLVGIWRLVMLPQPPLGPVAAPGQALAVASHAVRHVRLPDGTVVILKPGSRLRYHSAGGPHDARLVRLQGEAYFAVHHDRQRPFRIQTGPVTTTVLGTVFTVKALAAEPTVTVSVLSGRVQVADAHHQVALLTHDQQVIYQPGQPDVTRPVAAEKAAAWTHQDLQFEHQTLGEVAAVLSRRFGVPIRFRHAQAATCTVSAYFLGPESLPEILATLCATTGATYQLDTKTGAVWIDGAGC